ncbi:hypothetical protein DFJ58DRAFT_718504 [Suillus subalutaceus]|uniref:uncharacterized protein n=1 Tax=Suillus subalutaceus TaxID=48586 RepID=UPI001B87522F|nr:uncharacterized protein DFJ58DRAFT_718504 [Suillus subalutaceus]KAG1839753.1 hypothetical protein DFJ58DRAFT_718504 [Suillus subalutaceus]
MTWPACVHGHGDYVYDTICRNCHSDTPQFHCKDCFSTELCCHDCIIASHTKNPSHRIQEWTGSYFVTISLKTLGLRVQLGHPTGERYLMPERAYNDDFTLIDTNGIHEIGLDFCGCETAQTHTIQLLCTAWFLATTTDPRTAATFRILEQYHILSFESKCSGYEFYHADHYEAFMRIVHEWRHLKMLKRAGWGYDSASVEGTGHGECAVICPACLQPGKNLPDNWNDALKGKRWLYGLFLAIDANFHLKRRMVSKDSMDPGLSRRWAYFVEETAYKAYLQTYSGNPQEKSTCSFHNAVNMADTKVSHGLAATGVGTIDCARHNMKLPNGIGDLQKGERYMNMDFLFFSTLRGRCIDTLNVSYDIACQWHKNLWQRMSTMPLDLHLDHLATFVRFFVPKFHLPAHILTRQTKFSFNFSKYVGRTDGEAPERGWSNINPVASSTKEMGPGSQRDALDDHFGDWNWKKVVGLGATLLRKMIEAKEEHEAHQTAFQELDEALVPETTEAWKVEIKSWEENPNDSSVTNPFEAKVIPVTQAAVRLKLAQLKASELHQGTDISMHADVSPSIFIALGIDLENEQRRLKVDIMKQGLHATDTQMGTVQRLRNALQHKIDTWKRIQALYTPAVQLLESRVQSPSHSTSDTINPEDSQLWLPSALCSKPIPCNPQLLTIEWELRHAQAGDTLEEIRQSLRLRDYMYTFKRDWIRGQSANTRAQNALNRIEARATAAGEKYRAARMALSSLAHVLGHVGWDNKYRVLERKDDIRGMSVPKRGESEGMMKMKWYKIVSWSVSHDRKTLILPAGLRVEWCKARARSMRWAEEVELLQEEMRRVSCFLRWHASWWKKKIAEHTLQGLSAYAYRQARLRDKLAHCFEIKWAAHLPLTAACNTTCPADSEADLDLYLPELLLP